MTKTTKVQESFNEDLPEEQITKEEETVEEPQIEIPDEVEVVTTKKEVEEVIPSIVSNIAPPTIIKTVPLDKKNKQIDVSDLVYIRRRTREEVTYRYGEGINAADIQADELKYIGSSFSGKGKDTLRGLTTEEEKTYLPSILGISPTSPDWDKATKEYWLNIRTLVPAGNIGLELQIGFRYPNKEIAIEAEKRYEVTKNIRSRSKYGTPINLDNYIIYRYCLLYGKVANDFESVNMSEKIEFYMYSKAKAISDQYKTLMITNDAQARFLQIIGDIEKKTAVLIRFGENVRHLTNQEIDIKLAEMVKNKPRLFKEYVDDPDLALKSLIEEAIVHQKLIKTPNTEIIHYNNRLLGNNIQEVVTALKSPEHSKDLLALKSQIAYLTEKRLAAVSDDDAVMEDY